MWIDPESAKLYPCRPSPTLSLSFIIPTLYTHIPLLSDILRYDLNLRTTAFELEQPKSVE